MSTYLKSIALRNIGGLPKFDCNFHDVTIILGDNHTGKSSLLGAVASLFEGGSAPDMLHNGAGKGTVSIDFANGYKAVKEITASGFKVTVTDDNGGVVKAPATKLGEWVPKDGFDIREMVAMVQHDPKALEKFLLEHLPLSFSVSEVNAAAAPIKSISKPLTLPDLNALRQSLYDSRADVNRDIRNLKGTIANLEAALPEDDAVTDWAGVVQETQRTLGALEEKIANVKTTLKTVTDQAITEKRREVEEKIQALRDELTAFEKQAAADLAVVMEEKTSALTKEREGLTEQLGIAKARSDAQTKAAGVRESIEAEKARLNGHVTRETQLSMALEEIDKLKGSKLKELPIPGLDIQQDGKNTTITVDGVPLHRKSGQEQIFLVVQFVVAAQRAAGAEMPFIVCEGAELAENYLIELGDACREAGVQLVVTMRRPNEPLQVLSLEQFKNLVGVTA